MHTRLLSAFVIGLVATCASLGRAADAATTVSFRLRQDTNLYLQNDAPVAAGVAAPALPAHENAWLAQTSWSARETWRHGDAFSIDATYGAEATRYADHAA